jgi:hypothetical protein
MQLDVRAVAADTPLRSFNQGGLGLLRFDEAHDGLRLGGLLFDYTGPVTETLRAFATAEVTADQDKNPIDLTQAYLEWRPVPASALRWRTKLGAFYPPISLENRGVGWQSIYSLSPSALNTWIGEEIRTIGAETALTLSGAGSGRALDASVIVGAYGWNDPAGVLIYQRGWAIHDRQTALFGRLPKPSPFATDRHGIEFFHEIDNRAGYYVGVEAKYLDRLVVRALRYDNRGDPAAENGKEYAWLTRFSAFGFRLELPESWTVIAQRLNGDTSVGPSDDGRGAGILDYWAHFILLSKAIDSQRITVRYDRFYTETVRGAQFFDSEQNGHAWTLAYMFDWNRHWQFVAEGLKNTSTLKQRALHDLPPRAAEKTLQVAVRYTF